MATDSHSHGSSPELILLPGLDGTGDLFEPLLKALPSGIPCHVISYPMDEPLDYEQLMPLVTACIPEEKPYFILGESFSGPLAVMAGARNRENLLGIILVATFVKSPVPGWLGRLGFLLRGPMLELRPRKLIVDRLLGRKCDMKTRRWVHETVPRLARDVLMTRINAVLGVNVREELKRCQVPLLYLAGARDWLVGRKSLDAVWLCRPDVRIKVLDGTHMILQTCPDQAAAAIEEFMCRSKGQARRPMSNV